MENTSPNRYSLIFYEKAPPFTSEGSRNLDALEEDSRKLEGATQLLSCSLVVFAVTVPSPFLGNCF